VVGALLEVGRDGALVGVGEVGTPVRLVGLVCPEVVLPEVPVVEDPPVVGVVVWAGVVVVAVGVVVVRAGVVGGIVVGFAGTTTPPPVPLVTVPVGGGLTVR
jgi:hypothetical protein